MVKKKKSLKVQIRNILDGGGKVAMAIQGLIVISLISFSLETHPNLSEKEIHMLAIVELITISVFTIEYILRIITYEKPLKFIFSWWGLVDVLAILPYYLVSGVDLRFVRVFRLLRLVRILKFFRNSNALKRLLRSFVLAKDELILFVGMAVVILYISSVGIYYFENPVQPEHFQSIHHSFWWAVVTLSTVGYGDVYPITAIGKLFTSIIVLVGIGFVAMPASIMAAALSQARREEKETKDKKKKKKRAKTQT